jgi:putative transposase
MLGEYKEVRRTSRRRYATDLSNAEWALLAPLLPPEKTGGRHRENDLREVIHGIRYVLRTGPA